MIARDKVPFGDLLLDSKDGEWGEGFPGVGLVAADMIRGTDFAELNSPFKVLPRRYVNEKHAARKRLQIGDIVFEMAGGTAKQSTGRSAIVTKAFLEQRGDVHVLCASFCRHLRFDQTKYHPQYVYYLLQALYAAGYMAVFNIQHTGVSRFQYTSFKKHTVLDMPKLATQQKIAAILSTYDDLIANHQRRITLLERMAEDIYREWFVRLRFPGHENAKVEKGVPQGWRVAALGEIFKTASGGTPSRAEPTNFDGEIAWIKTGELKTMFAIGSEERITQRGIDSSAAKVYKKHTVVMAMYCAMPDLSVIANDAATNQACCAFIPRNKNFHHSFSYFLIKFAQLQLVSFAHGAAQQNLSQEIIKKFPVWLPSENLISAFGATMSPIFDSIEVLMRSNLQIKATRDSLLPRLISGKLSVDALEIRFPPGMREPGA